MKIFLLYIGFIMLAFTAAAQNPQFPNPKREEKIKALYVAYITQQLPLNAEEAQRFWPVHSQYEAELDALKNSNLDELSRQQATLNVKKKYQSTFARVIGNDRTNNFFVQDAGFRQKLIQRLQQARQERKINGASRPGMKRENIMNKEK